MEVAHRQREKHHRPPSAVPNTQIFQGANSLCFRIPLATRFREKLSVIKLTQLIPLALILVFVRWKTWVRGDGGGTYAPKRDGSEMGGLSIIHSVLSKGAHLDTMSDAVTPHNSISVC